MARHDDLVTSPRARPASLPRAASPTETPATSALRTHAPQHDLRRRSRLVWTAEGAWQHVTPGCLPPSRQHRYVAPAGPAPALWPDNLQEGRPAPPTTAHDHSSPPQVEPGLAPGPGRATCARPSHCRAPANRDPRSARRSALRTVTAASSPPGAQATNRDSRPRLPGWTTPMRAAR